MFVLIPRLPQFLILMTAICKVLSPSVFCTVSDSPSLDSFCYYPLLYFFLSVILKLWPPFDCTPLTRLIEIHFTLCPASLWIWKPRPGLEDSFGKFIQCVTEVFTDGLQPVLCPVSIWASSLCLSRANWPVLIFQAEPMLSDVLLLS